MNPTIIEATTISDAWFKLVYSLVRGTGHNVYTIDKGSYVGQKRLEYDFVFATIRHPGIRPLIPEIPPGLNIPPPVDSVAYVEEYFAKYLMDPELEPNETYKYATWLVPGVERVIEQLKGAPGNNQACISIGGMCKSTEPQYDGYGNPVDWLELMDTDDVIDPATGERDPACLRTVDFRLDQENELHMFVYFRSNDLWSGFPANLAGLQLLKEYVAQEIGAEDGRIVYASKGCHIYSHAIQVAAARVGMHDVDSMDSLAEAIKGKTHE